MARLTLAAGESVGLSSGSYTIYGSASGAETVTIAAGTTVTLDASFNRGGDTVTLSGNASAYTAVRSGSSIILTDTSGGVVTIPVGTTSSTVKFADVTAGRSLVYDTTAGAITLGSQTVTTTSGAVDAGSGGGSTDSARTMTLTTGLNTGSGFTGGSGDDTFDGSTSNSLNTGDVLAGGAGTDTVSATLNGSTAAPNMSGVEIVNLTVSTSAATLSAANVTGVTTINNVGSTANLTVTNLGTVPTTLGLNTNSNTTTLNFSTAALAGDADELTVNLDGASGNATVALELVAGATGELETVSLVSGSVANVLKTLVSENVSVATVEISGDQDLTVTDAFGDTVTTISAGSASGKLTFTTGADDTTVTTGSGNDAVTSNAGNDTISLGAGNDTITSGAGKDNIDGGAGTDRIQFDGVNLDSNDTIAGGDGADTIVLTANATVVDTDFRNITTVESLTAAANTAIVATLNANADASGIATITGAGAADDNITVGAGFDNALTVALGTGNDNVSASGSNASLTVTAVASAIDANDVLTGGALTGDTIKLTANGGTATFGGSVTKFETIQAVAGSTADNDIVIALHANMVSGANTLTVDASGLSNSNATLTLSSAGFNANSTLSVTGGSGADTITGSSEKSNFAGGAGNDVFRFDSSVLDANDTVSGGDGTDTIQLTNDTGSYVDTDFTSVTGVEVVSANGAANWSATFNGNADAAGFTTVTSEAGSNTTVTLGSAFDNDLRINLSDGADTVAAASSNAAVTVSTNAANYTTADSLAGGGGTGDVIRVTMGAGGETAVFGNVSGFETITVVGSGDNDVTLTMNDTMIAANGSLTVDATDLSNSNATLTLTSAETTTTATLTVNGGAGADTIIGGSEKSNFSGNAGNDVFRFDAAVLASTDTISGGDGTDSIQISANHANGVTDSDFLNITGVETLTVSATGNQVVATFNANADASGISTVTGVGAANDVITLGSAFDNALRVNLATGNDVINASASAGTITAYAASAAFDANDTIIGGTGSGDTIRILADGDSTGAVFGANVSGVENIVIVGDNDIDVKVTTSDAMTNRAVTLTVDATDLSNSNATLTFVSGEATDELVTINVTGGNGADQMTGGLEQSNFSGGAGNDTFTFTAANLNAYDTVSGGAGTDTLSVSGTIVDSDFTYVSNVEALGASSGNLALTLGSAADASGLATITGGSGNDSVTIGSGFDNAIRVVIGAGDDVVSANGSAAVVTISSASAISSADTLIGGTTSGDVISISANTSATFGGNVSGFETISVSYNAGGADVTSIVAHDNMTASGATLTVTAAAENTNTDAFNFSGGAELDGKFDITGSAGADSISGGLQADTISGGNGADIILGGGGADVLTGGLGADTITGGAGADSIVLTEASASADIVKFTSNLFVEAGDTITGFNANAGTDVIQFSNSVVTNGANNETLLTTDVNGTIGANDVFIEITTTLSDLTSASSVASSLSGFTVSNVASGETVIFALQDGTDTYLWAFTQDSRAGIQSSDLTYVAKVVGITDIANGDLALGA